MRPAGPSSLTWHKGSRAGRSSSLASTTLPLICGPVQATPALFDHLLRQPGVVETVELRSPFGFMAFHGGLEGGTETIAAEAAALAGASLYTVVQPADLVWHVPSALVSPEDSAELTRFLEHVAVVVAVHGYGRPGRSNDVLVGGSNRRLAAHLAAGLRALGNEFTIVDELDAIPAELRGL